MDAFCKIVDTLKSAGIEVTSNSVTRITDFRIIQYFVNTFFKNDFSFGCDMRNGYCSGAVRDVHMTSDGILSIWTDDIKSEFRFRLASLGIALSSPTKCEGDEESKVFPFFLFDSLDDRETQTNEILKNIYVSSDAAVVQSIKLIDGQEIYDRDLVFHILDEKPKDFQLAERYNSFRYYFDGVVCFIDMIPNPLMKGFILRDLLRKPEKISLPDMLGIVRHLL